MNWKLYLDDKRPLPEGYVLARSFAEGQKLVFEKGCPSFISFDHDLGLEEDGSELNGYDFAKWLVSLDMDGVIDLSDDFGFKVHSSNPAGRINIESYINGYLNHKKNS